MKKRQNTKEDETAKRRMVNIRKTNEKKRIQESIMEGSRKSRKDSKQKTNKKRRAKLALNPA